LPENKIVCSPGEVIEDLSFEVLDETEAVMMMSTTFQISIVLNWQRSKKQNVPIKDSINIPAPTRAGFYYIDITVAIKGRSIKSMIEIEVLPGNPHTWIFDSRPNINLAAGSVSQGILEFCKCVYLVDEHGNQLSSNGGSDPFLEVFRLHDDANQMDCEDNLRKNKHFEATQKIPLSANSSATSGRKRGSSHEESNAIEFVIGEIPQDVAEIMDSWSPHQKIGLRVQSDKSDVEPSEFETVILGLGLPYMLLISGTEFGVMGASNTANITISLRNKPKSLKLHVQDTFKNELSLDSNWTATLVIFNNDHRVYSSKKKANILFANPFILPEEIWQSGSESFSLRFELELLQRTTNIQLVPATLYCNIFVANNVTGLELQCAGSATPSSEIQLSAGSCMPALTMKLVTEDGKPCPMISMQSFEFKIWEKQKGRRRLMNYNDFYIDQSLVIGHGQVRFEPKFLPLETAPASYIIEITYVELRNEMEKLDPSVSITIHVAPTEPKSFSVTEEAKSRLREVAYPGGEIGRNIRFNVKDRFGNEIEIGNNYQITCRAVRSDDSQTPAPTLVVEKGHQQSNGQFSRIGLAGIPADEGVRDGRYYLLFTIADAGGNVLLQNNESFFDFTSNETYTKQTEELRNRMIPFQEQIQHHTALQDQLMQLRQREQQACEALSLQTPDRAAMEDRRSDIENGISAIIKRRQSAIPVRKRSPHLDLQLQSWIDNDNVLGRVVDLALVKDRKYIHILSLACRPSIDGIVCKDKVAVNKMWDAGFDRFIALSMIVPFKSRAPTLHQSTVRELQLEKIEMRNSRSWQPTESPGNPKYLVS
jgi:hypothetical protein